jgi:hypothetical protein
MILVYNCSPEFQAYFQIFRISQYIVGDRIVQSIFMQDEAGELFRKKRTFLYAYRI